MTCDTSCFNCHDIFSRFFFSFFFFLSEGDGNEEGGGVFNYKPVIMYGQYPFFSFFFLVYFFFFELEKLTVATWKAGNEQMVNDNVEAP